MNGYFVPDNLNIWDMPGKRSGILEWAVLLELCLKIT